LAETDVSPRIRKITSQAEADAFWKEIGLNGSPLIEPIKDDPMRRFTTFLWRGNADTQRVFLSLPNCSPDPFDCFLYNVEGTDVWYRRLRLDHRLRTTYLLTPVGKPGRIFPWKKTHPSPDRSSHRNWDQ